RGLHPPPAQEDRAGAGAYRDGARPRLLPREDRGLRPVVAEAEARPREQRSLFGEILDWMLAPLLLLWPMSVVLTWLVAQGIANKPYDRQLGEMVRVLSKQVSVQAPGGTPLARFVLPAGASEILHTDETDDIYYQVLGL